MADNESWSEISVGEEEENAIAEAAAVGLKRRREDFVLEAPFLETLLVEGSRDCSHLSAHDDLQRELGFYEMALDAAEIALEKLEEAGVPTQRPADYFAEMVKTDKHMEQVRVRLATEKKRVEQIEQRKRDRELRQFGKAKQQEVAATRRKEAAEAVQSVKKWQKRKKQGSATDVELEDLLAPQSQAPKKKRRHEVEEQQRERPAEHTGGRRKGPNRKRQAKNAKFGKGPQHFGANSKKNTSESSSQMTDFRQPKKKNRGGNRGGKPRQQQSGSGKRRQRK